MGNTDVATIWETDYPEKVNEDKLDINEENGFGLKDDVPEEGALARHLT